MPIFDSIVVGGGPAGLTAALYLARFHLKVLVIDRGDGRATQIPRTHNHPGFPDGISGHDLLLRMQEHMRRYGAGYRVGTVDAVAITDDVVGLRVGTEELSARTVLLATGVCNRRPPLSSADHTHALQRGLIRYCPICDAYEVSDRRVGVWGNSESAVNEAIFLRSFTQFVTLVSPDGAAIEASARMRLNEAGIGELCGSAPKIRLGDGEIFVDDGHASHVFDSLYVALGSDTNSALAASLGVELAAEGCIKVDRHQRTNVTNVYAAGDIVLGLDQISHAMGEGAVAATAIRNDLAGRRPMHR